MNFSVPQPIGASRLKSSKNGHPCATGGNPFLVEDFCTSNHSSDSGVDCCSNSSNSSGGKFTPDSEFSPSGNKFSGDSQFPPSRGTSTDCPEGITLRSHRVLKTNPRICRVPSDDSNCSGNVSSGKRGPLRITFRMKRSAVLDEVIESAATTPDEIVSNGFAPHYEILRFDASGSSSAASSRRNSASPGLRKKSKKRKKKRKWKEDACKDSYDGEGIVCSARSPKGAPEASALLSKIPRAEGKGRSSSSSGSSSSTHSVDCERRSARVSSTTPPACVSKKAKRLRLVIGKEACTIIDIPPNAFDSSPSEHFNS